jgi:DNA-binding beta-propeller fold protein YncE
MKAVLHTLDYRADYLGEDRNWRSSTSTHISYIPEREMQSAISGHSILAQYRMERLASTDWRRKNGLFIQIFKKTGEEFMFKCSAIWAMSIVAFLGYSFTAAQADPLMIVGNDEKLLWDDNGKPIILPAGKDSVLIVDLANPENPKIIANLPLKNSVVGPPVNLDIDPTGSVALVADSIDVTKDGDTLKMGPDDKVYMIDLKVKPPKLVNTLTVGKQPSGLSFNPAGNLALVANRVDKSITVLSVKGTDVKVIDTVPMDDIVTHVTFTPDGKRALATKFNANKVSLLDVNGDKVTYTKLDLPTGLWPYSVAVAPSGKIALTADSGTAGQSDGSVHTVDVVDLEAQPPRIIDRVVVGDAPEGLAISPKGNIAVAAIYRGSNNKNAYYYHRNGSIAVLRIDGKKVTMIKEIEVGGLPEGAVFTPDGRYILIGNYLDQDFSILRVDGTKVTDTGKRFKVPGHPGSARMSPK